MYTFSILSTTDSSRVLNLRQIYENFNWTFLKYKNENSHFPHLVSSMRRHARKHCPNIRHIFRNIFGRVHKQNKSQNLYTHTHTPEKIPTGEKLNINMTWKAHLTDDEWHTRIRKYVQNWMVHGLGACVCTRCRRTGN